MAAIEFQIDSPRVAWFKNLLNLAVRLIWRLGPLRLAIGLRLSMTALILIAPVLLHRGFWLQGDVEYYYYIGTLSDSARYPFLHYWVEYPPVFPILVVALYRGLALVHLEGQASFVLAFQIVMAAVDLASLILLHRIVLRAWSARAAATATLVYATSPLAIYFALGWFDALAVLFLFAGLFALLNKRVYVAGVIVGLGILVKFIPGALLLAAPMLLSRRDTGRVVLVMLATLAAVLVPIALLRSDLLVATFASMITRGPWETLPAVLVGYYKWGQLADDRFVASTAYVAASPSGGAGPLLLQVGTGLLALFGATLALYRRPDARHALLVVSLGVVAFAVGNKGFSPQFAAWLIPVILLAFPNRRGVVYVLLLTACMICYYPIVHRAMVNYFVFGMGSIDSVVVRMWSYVVIRTLILGVLLIDVFRASTSLGRQQRGSLATAAERCARPRAAPDTKTHG